MMRLPKASVTSPAAKIPVYEEEQSGEISRRALSFSGEAAREELGSRPTAMHTPFAGRSRVSAPAIFLMVNPVKVPSDKLADFITNISLQIGHASHGFQHRRIVLNQAAPKPAKTKPLI